MPFVSSIRRNYDQPRTETRFEVTGGDEIITAGGYRIHMFTKVGDSELVIRDLRAKSGMMELRATGGASTLNTEYLVIAGGGSGGTIGGGGGAGGYRTGSLDRSAGPATVTVGNGGPQPAATTAYNINGSSGGNSVFATITSTGGGFGAAHSGPVTSGGPGGSGGGAAGHAGGGGGGAGGAGTSASSQNSAGGTGTPGQGNIGGNGRYGAGNTATVTGGPGLSSSITGLPVGRAGGGGGGIYPAYGGASGPASSGGGAGSPSNGAAGSTNTGGGGGGGGHPGNFSGGAGGSGIVVVRYLV